MHILYIHQYFKIPSEPGGTRSYWVAKRFIEEGHKVTMLTTSSSIQEKIVHKTIDGIEVIYLKVPYNQNMSIMARVKSFLNFMIKSTRLALKVKNVDLALATSTPLTVGFPTLVLKKLRKIPFIFEVRDLWPEVPIQMGGLDNKLLQKLAVSFEKSIYKNAKHIVALSPGMAAGVLKYEPKEKVSMIPNMAKIDAFWPREKNEQLQTELGLRTDSFKLIHFGALGIANGAMSIIRGAEELKEDTSIEFIFIGGGSTEEELKTYCQKHQLKQVHFLGRFPMKETSEIVNLCDVSMVSFKDLPILYTNSPNKLFDSLSAGKPIIVNSAGWTKDMVEKHNCGFYVNPNVAQELVDKILLLKKNPEIVKEMGRKSRTLAETVYDKSILCKQFVETVENTYKNL
ncbi:glycosyltransferase involved in cell wall biosynthesis [Tenacibaculum gallaicum]|uniref:Glycosyltransferase involved in cell wall biosynthesis n=1 Tax=Tenacibaculum gallaicum TaxID=561505 RepID=A0A3E0HH76_9FLAO|nr:glycosyltransferase family 4 protein [Tenacibaculum gallaicum]REH45778.1 glycosyltransferase involved in cell wall biosynthesis [Tenacibaculum gallaicum]